MSAAPAEGTEVAAAIGCPRCGTEIAPQWLHCPACRWLVHGEELGRLAGRAETEGARGDLVAARQTWRRVLELLPRDADQHAQVARRIDALGEQIDAQGASAFSEAGGASESDPTAPGHGRGALKGAAAGVAGVGLLLWKFKAVLAFALTKGKLLLLGLTKSSTFFSMLLSLGVYWTVFGWMFALGLVLSIYVHEIGHVAALRHLGIRASAPMFVPGLGALVRLKEYPASPREDARVGLAGPLWGLGAAAITFAAFLVTGWPILAAIARVGAWLNLFNLIPVWQLDGSRGLRALSRGQRWIVIGVAAGVGLLIQEMLFLLIGGVALLRAFARGPEQGGDSRALATFVLLLVGLGALCAIEVPGIVLPGAK